VYAHTTNDVTTLVKGDGSIALCASGLSTPIQVIMPNDQYWPLPGTSACPNVGWWSEPAETFTPTPIILAAPEVEPALLPRLYDIPGPGERMLYVPLFERPLQLRPGRVIAGYVTVEIWEAMQRKGK
jgi:hypothetical protein